MDLFNFLYLLDAPQLNDISNLRVITLMAGMLSIRIHEPFLNLYPDLCWAIHAPWLSSLRHRGIQLRQLRILMLYSRPTMDHLLAPLLPSCCESTVSDVYFREETVGCQIELLEGWRQCFGFGRCFEGVLESG